MKIKDIKGQTFGSLTVIKKSTKTDTKRRVFWVCKCHCGRFLVVRGDALRLGGTTQCSVCRGGRGGRLSKFVEEGDLYG